MCACFAQLRMLLSVTRSIADESNLRSAIDRIISVAARVVHADRCTLFVVDKSTRTLRVAVSKGSVTHHHSSMSSVEVPLDRNSIAGYCAVVSTATQSRWWLPGIGTASVAWAWLPQL